jgi:uncharacterized membrane protein
MVGAHHNPEKEGLAKRLNIFCLFIAITVVAVFPLKKEIWYDETVSVLCSKGISHDSPALFANTNVLHAAQINDFNNVADVFHATVVDNGNSFIYNLTLHWYTELFGNSLFAYTSFSRLLAIATLLAFFVLCKQLFKNSIFTSVAILLLASDNDFMGMSHEIRAYSMGIFFVTMAAVQMYRFIHSPEKTKYLLYTGLFSAAAILSHFLAVYVVIGFVIALVFIRRMAIFSLENLLAVLVPVGILALYFLYAVPGLQHMSIQNHAIQESTTAPFSLAHVSDRSARFMALNFKTVFPAFFNNPIVSYASVLFVIALYITGIKCATNRTSRRGIHLLFILGICSSLFLAALSIRSQHYTSLYYRYYSFGIPFSCLFIAFVLYVISWNSKIHKLIKAGLVVIVLVPSVTLFAIGLINAKPALKYNHAAIARQIEIGHLGKISVPTWHDAMLVHSFLANGYKIDYFRNPEAQYFILYKADANETAPVVKDEH